MACKPGSVPAKQQVMTIPLGILLPKRSSNRPGQRRENSPATKSNCPYWSCSRWGLPCHPCHQGRGALLPHPFTLTCHTEVWSGGLLSVALSLRSPSLAVNQHRISVEPGLSSPTQGGGGHPAICRSALKHCGERRSRVCQIFLTIGCAECCCLRLCFPALSGVRSMLQIGSNNLIFLSIVILEEATDELPYSCCPADLFVSCRVRQ